MQPSRGVSPSLLKPAFDRPESPLRGAPANCSCYKPATRNSFLLPHNDCSLSKATAAGSTLPAYLFAAVPNASSDPFGCKLLSSSAIELALSNGRGGSSPTTRCPIPHSKLPNVHPLSLLFRTLRSFRLIALTRRLSSEKLALRTARLPFAPR